jgi:SAM-dependent methyltransferase
MHQTRIDLIKSTRQVFEECSKIYLKEDKHWGCDLDIISEYVEKFKNPKLIELGTGYAWHLANLFFVSSAEFERVVGLDYSPNMLEKAHSLLNSISYNGTSLAKRIELKEGSVLSVPYEDESFDVALMLNNTLGNIPAHSFNKAKDQRRKALSEAKRVLSPTGYLILSVYNATKLTEEDKYGEVFDLDHDLSNLETSDLVVRYKKTDTPYYSHWFNINEIRQLVYDVSFKIVEAEERRNRIIVVAQKKRKES